MLWAGTHLAHDAYGYLFQAGIVCPVATLVQVPQQALYHIAACLSVLHNMTSISESHSDKPAATLGKLLLVIAI